MQDKVICISWHGENNKVPALFKNPFVGLLALNKSLRPPNGAKLEKITYCSSRTELENKEMKCSLYPDYNLLTINTSCKHTQETKMFAPIDTAIYVLICGKRAARNFKDHTSVFVRLSFFNANHACVLCSFRFSDVFSSHCKHQLASIYFCMA